MIGRRASILREMGLGPLWRLRSRMKDEEVLEVPAPVSKAEAVTAPAVPVRNEFPEQRKAKLPVTKPSSVPTVSFAERAARIGTLDWEALEAEIQECSACGLYEKRQRAVPGTGDRTARVMFVGEGPGAAEDRQGLPFVGSAGQLLNAMLTSIGLDRQNGVYIANAVKCRPPLNRTPQAEEMATCRPFLDRQIELVAPDLLVALGRPAAQVLLDQPELRINAAREKTFSCAGIPVIVTYHPAYLLRNPTDKVRAWEDLCRIRRLLAETDKE